MREFDSFNIKTMKKTRKVIHSKKLGNGKKRNYIDENYQKLSIKLKVPARSYFKLEEVDRKNRLIRKNNHYLDLGAFPGSWSTYICRATNHHVHLTMIDTQKMNRHSELFTYWKTRKKNHPTNPTTLPGKTDKETPAQENDASIGNEEGNYTRRFIQTDINQVDKARLFPEGITNSLYQPKNSLYQPTMPVRKSPYSKFDGILSDMSPKTIGNKSKDSYDSYLLVLEGIRLCSFSLKKGGFFLAKYLEGEEIQSLKKIFQQNFGRQKIIVSKASRSFSREIFILGSDFKG